MGKGIPLRPSWTANLGAMIDEGIDVRAKCSTCGACKDVNLPALAEKLGRQFDLWGRRPRCTMTRGCPGRVLFLHSGRGPFSPMKGAGR